MRLWRQYREASEAVREWADQQLGQVKDLPPEEAVIQVKVNYCSNISFEINKPQIITRLNSHYIITIVFIFDMHMLFI